MHFIFVPYHEPEYVQNILTALCSEHTALMAWNRKSSFLSIFCRRSELRAGRNTTLLVHLGAPNKFNQHRKVIEANREHPCRSLYVFQLYSLPSEHHNPIYSNSSSTTT